MVPSDRNIAYFALRQTEVANSWDGPLLTLQPSSLPKTDRRTTVTQRPRHDFVSVAGLCQDLRLMS